MTATEAVVGPVTTPRPGGTWMAVALLVLGSLLGGVAYYRYTLSDRFLSRSLAQFRDRRPALSAVACVDEALRWSARCEAMKTLCDASVPRMMGACLTGADRAAHCRELGDRVRATQFGVPECKARKLDRRQRKICDLSYRGIAAHCERLRSAAR